MSIMGECTEQTITKIPMIDRDGNYVMKNGKQQYVVKTIVNKKLAPNATLLQFYLKAHKPETYLPQAQSHEAALPLEQLEADVLEHLKLKVV